MQIAGWAAIRSGPGAEPRATDDSALQSARFRPYRVVPENSGAGALQTHRTRRQKIRKLPLCASVVYSSSFCSSLTKYRRTHPHISCALLDCHAVIATHTHRQVRKRKPKLNLQPVTQLPQLNKVSPGIFRVGAWRRNGHESLDLNSVSSRNLFDLRQ